MKRIALLVLCLMFAGAAPALASAPLHPCDGIDGAQCGTVDVPLDRAHPGAGSLAVAFVVFPHTDASRPAKTPVFATEGGPGYSITQNPTIDGYPQLAFADLRPRHDLVLIDQRGVGLSSAIDCPSLQPGTDDPYGAFSACGALLGHAADEYGTGDVALDVDAVRRALGYPKIAYYGASYSAVDAQAYAAHFPGRVESIVLDSPVKVAGFDPFYRSNPPEMARALDLVCARSASCSADHRRASDDLAWLARRLRQHPLDATAADATGTAHELHVTEGFLASHIMFNDSGAFIGFGELAAAATALRDGDPAPLLRLAADSDGPFFGDQGDPASFSSGDNAARYCTDMPFPWSKSAPVEVRRRQWQHARDALAPDTFAPFSVDGWLAPPPDGLAPDPCIGWPAPGPGVEPVLPPRASFPAVPVLVINGDLDMNTPSADARDVARRFPAARFVELADSGHHTVFNWRSECSAQIIQHFLETFGTGDTSCAREPGVRVPALGRFPLVASAARPAAVDGAGDRSTATDRKVAGVAAATLIDALHRGYMTGEDGVGLRGGTFHIEFGDTATALDLDAARFATDVTVSGHATAPFDDNVVDGEITVDGPGAEDGALHVTGAFIAPDATTLHIDGTVGGHAVSLSIPAT